MNTTTNGSASTDTPIKLPRLCRRFNSFSNVTTYYVAGSYQDVPHALTRHRERFMTVGKTLYVVPKPPRGSKKLKLHPLVDSKLTLRQLSVKFGPEKTIGEVLHATGKPQLRPATVEEAAKYVEAVAKLNQWLVTYIEKRDARRKAEVDRKCRQAEAVLRRHGRIL